MTAFRTATVDDWTAIERLLTTAGLPVDGAREHLEHFEVAHDGDAIIGCAAIEPYDTAALLRSVVVDPQRRGSDLGETLVLRMIDRARRAGARSLWLLTTTAAEWFPRFGFVEAQQDDVPDALRASKEFRGACSDSAKAMRLKIR